jgi:hypothetical protein
MAAIFVIAIINAAQDKRANSPHIPADLQRQHPRATIREPFEPQPDDPSTTNDESNDQPVGHFGTLTLEVESYSSGNTYTLDVELDGLEVERIYFPKGGWVRFYGCELDEDYTGECDDAQGRTWAFHGEG